MAEGRLAKAEPDPGGTFRHIGVLPPVILGLLFKLRTNPDFMHIVHCHPAVSRFDLERAREEADEKKGRAERARQEYGVQAGFLVLYKAMVMVLVLV